MMTLEERVIFLENDIERLSTTLYKQEKKIADLEKMLQILNNNISENKDNHNGQVRESLPPHY